MGDLDWGKDAQPVALVDDATGNKVTIVDNGDGSYSILVNTNAIASTQNEYNVTLTLADTEYSQALPADTRAIEFRNRSKKDLRYAFTTGKVATPTAPYFTLESGSAYSKENLNLNSKTIYFASSNAGDVVELLVWTK